MTDGISVLKEWMMRYPELKYCERTMTAAWRMLVDCFAAGGKLLTCGNGGSAADSGHIAGELLKSFRMARPIPESDRAFLMESYGEEGNQLADWLEQSLPVIALPDQTAVLTAIANDVCAQAGYAQLVYGLGCPRDTFLGISTSGNSKNVVYAAQVAKLKGMNVIALVGESVCALDRVADVTIHAPALQTAYVQEYHLPIYHALCAAIEAELFATEHEEESC